MADDEIITLDSGEQVRVDDQGQQILIPGPDPEIADMMAKRAERDAQLAEMRKVKKDALRAKREQDAADPSVPPEKRIF